MLGSDVAVGDFRDRIPPVETFSQKDSPMLSHEPTHAPLAGVDGVENSTPSVPSIVSIRKLKKTYASRSGEPVEAISDVSLEIAPSEFVTIVGPSGAGKTTLLNILLGLLPYSGGEVRYRGELLRGTRHDIGIVFQEPVLFPWRTILSNVKLPAEIIGMNKKLADTRAKELLELVGLKDFFNKYPAEISGGMQQRAAIARALINDPSLLLMDEPFGALDALTRETMNIELLRIWQETKKTILLVTHSIPESIFLADRVVVLGVRPSRVAKIVPIELERPRKLEMISTDAFGALQKIVRASLEVSLVQREEN
jgi:NitT/TauT family transport system ATP-binding protein